MPDVITTMKHAVAVAMLLRGVLSAQDVAGDWQEKLKLGTTELRVVIHIAKATTGGWTARELIPDEGSNGIVASSVTFDGAALRIAFDEIRATYEGRLTEDNTAFTCVKCSSATGEEAKGRLTVHLPLRPKPA